MSIFALGVLFLLFGGPALAILLGDVHLGGSWRTASHAPTGIAPDPTTTPEAVLQVYGARTYGIRGALGVHTWIAVKPRNASHFTVYEVIGWRHYHGQPVVSVSSRAPDGRWFNSEPEVYLDMRGPEVDAVIDKVIDAVERYPYANDYQVWPGPNSNTFTAFVAREVPEMQLDLPPTAVGKDFLPGGALVGETPSGTGYQISLLGLAGIMLAVEEGLEVNILGLTYGIDPFDFALKLPGLGRIGGGP
ncbi:MAG: DUF3750 domain-containing protein [Magnetospiraceae bacterium]